MLRPRKDGPQGYILSELLTQNTQVFYFVECR